MGGRSEFNRRTKGSGGGGGRSAYNRRPQEKQQKSPFDGVAGQEQAHKDWMNYQSMSESTSKLGKKQREILNAMGVAADAYGQDEIFRQGLEAANAYGRKKGLVNLTYDDLKEAGVPEGLLDQKFSDSKGNHYLLSAVNQRRSAETSLWQMRKHHKLKWNETTDPEFQSTDYKQKKEQATQQAKAQQAVPSPVTTPAEAPKPYKSALPQPDIQPQTDLQIEMDRRGQKVMADQAQIQRAEDDLAPFNPPVLQGTVLEQTPQGIRINDTAPERARMDNQFLEMFTKHYMDKGQTEAVAKAMANSLLGEVTNDPNEGIADYLGGAIGGNWRADWMQMLGIDGPLASMLDSDPFMSEVAKRWQGRYEELTRLEGTRRAYGSEISRDMLEQKVTDYFDVAFFETMKSSLGYIWSGFQTGLEDAQAKSAIVSYNQRKGIQNQLEKVVAGDLEALPSYTKEELKAYLQQNPDPIAQTITIGAQLLGSLKGSGSLNVSSKALRSTYDAYGAIKATERGAKLLDNAFVNGVSLLTRNTPELKDAANMAAMFSLSALLEDLPNATPEQLMQSAGSGAIFGMTGTLAAERFFYPIIRRNKHWQKVLQNPTARKTFEAVAGKDGIRNIENQISRDKELAYIASNIFANPAQSWIAKAVQGEEYSQPELLVDIIFGPFLGAHGRNILKDQIARNRGRVLTPEDIHYAAQADEAYRNTMRVEADKPADATPAPQDPIDIQSMAPEMPTAEEMRAVDEALRDEDKVQPRSPKAEGTFPDPTGEPQRLGDLLVGAEGLTEHQAVVKDFLQEKAGDVPVYFADTGNGSPALYDRTNKRIIIDRKYQGTDLARTAYLHEGIHAALTEAIRADSDMMVEAVKLRDMLANKTWFTKWAAENPREAKYMLENPDELLAGIVDDRFGIAKHLDNRSKWPQVMKDKVLGLVTGTEQGAADVTKAFDSILKRATVEPDLAKPQQMPIIEGRVAELTDRIMELSQIENPTPGEIAAYEKAIKDLETLQAHQNRYGQQAEAAQGMYNDLVKAVDFKQVRDPLLQEVLTTQMAEFISRSREYGFKDEVAMRSFLETYADDEFAALDPLEKMSRLNRSLKEAVENPDLVNALREASDETADPSDIFDQDWGNKPVMGLNELKSLFALAGESHDTYSIEGWLQSKMKEPETFVDSFVELVDKGLEGSGLEEARKGQILEYAEKYAAKYFRNNHNAVEVEPIGFHSSGRLMTLKGVKYFYDHSYNEKTQRSRKETTPKRVQSAVQNPSALYHRLGNIKDEVLKAPNGQPWRILGPEHQRTLNTLAGAQLAYLNGNPPKGKNWTAKEAGLQLLENGYFLSSKGFDGAMVFDLKPLIRQSRDLPSLIKQVEEMNILHYLGSERTWGGPGKNKDVTGVLASMDLWKLVEAARKDEFTTPITEQTYVSFLSDEVRSRPEWLAKAQKMNKELTRAGNETVAHLRKMYAPRQSGYRPPILHQHGDIPTALGTVLNHFYHKVWDYANINDTITDERGKLPKNMGKYAGVATELGYINVKDAKSLNTLLQPYGYPDLDILSKPVEQRSDAMAAGKAYGVSWNENGDPRLKMFIMTDTWAEQHPELWRYFKGGEAQEIAPSALHDGASWIINDKTWELLAHSNGHDPSTMAAIKYGYAGDRIYKSNFSSMLDPEMGPLSEFLDMLKEQGYSGIVTQSAIKSKARNYKRAGIDGGKDLVYDDNGTLLGEEEAGEFTPYNDEEVMVMEAAMPFGPHNSIHFDLTGDNSWGYIKASHHNTKHRAPLLSIDKSPYAIPGYGGDIGERVRESIAAIQNNFAKEGADKFVAWHKMQRMQDLYRTGQEKTSSYLDDHARDLIETVIRKLERSDELSFFDNDPERHESLIRDLYATMRPDGSIDIPVLSAVFDTYPGVFTSRGGDKSMIQNILKDVYKDARSIRGFGMNSVLHPYVPNQAHYTDGLELSAYWKEQDLYQQGSKRGLKGDELDAFVRDGVAEYRQWAEQYLADPVNEVFDETGRLQQMGHGKVVAYGEIMEKNREILKRRARGEDVPLYILGTKDVTKLTPSDALDSYAPTILAGVDMSKYGGMMMNNEFLTTRQGRDYDGDEEGTILESKEWGGKFLDFWGALKDGKAHKGAWFKENPEGGELTLTNLAGKRYQPVEADMRMNDIASYEKAMTARGEGEKSIANGIVLVNQWYNLMRRMDLRDGDGFDLDYGDVRFKGKVDLALLDKNDSFYKQSQYDTYTGFQISDKDLFIGSRFENIQLKPSAEQDLVDEVKLWKSSGVVGPMLWEAYNEAAEKVAPKNAKGWMQADAQAGDTSQEGLMLAYMDRRKEWFRKTYGEFDLDNVTDRTQILQKAQKALRSEFPRTVEPQVASLHKKLTAPMEEAVAPSYRFNPYRDIPRALDGLDPIEQTGRLAVLAHALENSMPMNPGPKSSQDIRELHSRNQEGSWLINVGDNGNGYPEAQWKVKGRYMYLDTVHGEVPLTKAISPDGTLHPNVQALVDSGIPLREIFPYEITGRVLVDRSTADVKESDAVAKDKISKDQSSIWVRLSTFSDIRRDNSYDLSRELDNLEIVPIGDTEAFSKVFERAKAEGKTITLDLKSMNPKHLGENNYLDWIDMGRMVGTNREYTTDLRRQFSGRIAAALDKAGDFGLSNEMILNTDYPDDYFQGMSQARYKPTIDGERYTQDALFHETVEAYKARTEATAETFGMFNGSVGKLKASAWGLGKASGLNRLNKYIGEDIRSLSSDDLEKMQDTFAEFFREVYSDASQDAIERMLGVFAPEYLRDLENGEWRRLRASDPTKAENRIAVQKLLMTVQGLQGVQAIADQEKRGKLGTMAETYGFWTEQSIEARVNTFADDLRIVSGNEVLTERVQISHGPGGSIVESIPVTADTKYSRTTLAPKVKSAMSDTWVRHGERHRSMNGIKDLLKIDVGEFRKGIGEIFGTDKTTGMPELTDEAFLAVEQILKGQSEFADAEGNMPSGDGIDASVFFDGANSPAVTMTIKGQSFATTPDGFFDAPTLDKMVSLIFPQGQYQHMVTGQVMDSPISSVLKFALTTKAHNMRHGVYLKSLATQIKNYVDGIVSRYDADETVFKAIQDQADALSRELHEEADARLNSTLMDAAMLNRFVDRNDYSQRLHDLLDNQYDADGTKVVLPQVEAFAANRGMEYDDAIRLLHQRMRKMDAADNQMSRTTAFFERELTGKETNDTFYSTIDSEIMNEVFGTPIQYDANMLYELTADLTQKATNQINMLTMQAYKKEAAIREKLGLPTLKNPIAENNMLVGFVTDDTIWNRDHDIHSSAGLRAKIHWAAQDGRRTLTSQELGIKRGTPVMVSFRTAKGEDGDRYLSLQGRILGVGRINNKVTFNQQFQDMVGNAREDQMDVHLPEWAKEESYKKHRDMLVIENSKTGNISYIDLESVTQMTSGERHGKSFKFTESQYNKYYENLKIKDMDMMEYLLDGVESRQFEGLDANGERISGRGVTGIENKDVAFYAEVPRDRIPTFAGRAVDNVMKGYGKFPTHWWYLFGKQTAQLTGAAALSVLNPGFGMMYGAYALGSAAKKYGLNRLGNAHGFRWRTFVGSNMAGGDSFKNTFEEFWKARKNWTSGVEQSMAKARIGSSAGLASDATAQRRSNPKNTMPYLYAKKKMEKVHDIVTGWGKVLRPQDIIRVREVIDKTWGADSGIEAAIRNNRLALWSVDNGQTLKTLTELREMNLDGFNEALLAPARSVMGKPLQYASDAAARINNSRLWLAARLSDTEALGVQNAADAAGREFDKLNRTKGAVSDVDKRLGFIQAMVDINQGKFDERPLDMRTPMGRFFTLFSQYNRNWFRRSSLGALEENLMIHDLIGTYAADQEFLKDVFSKTGMDLGDERWMTAFSGIKVDSKTGDVSASPLRSRGLWLQAAWPLLKAGIGVIALGWLKDQEFLKKMLGFQVEHGTDMVMGDNTVIGTGVNLLVDAGELAWDRPWVDGWSQPEVRSVNYQVKGAMNDAVSQLSFGMGYRPMFELMGMAGLYSLHQSGMLPEYDGVYSFKQLQRTAEMTLGPVLSPTGEALNVWHELEKYEEKHK